MRRCPLGEGCLTIKISLSDNIRIGFRSITSFSSLDDCICYVDARWDFVTYEIALSDKAGSRDFFELFHHFLLQ